MDKSDVSAQPRERESAGESSRWYIYAVTLVASTGGFLFGYDLAIISGAGIFLRQHFELSPAMFGLANSSAVFGCIFGPLLGLWLADSLGRKYTLAVAAVCFMVSALGSAFCFGMPDFMAWRAVGGLGIGLAMVTSPMYIAELAPAHLRGRLVTINQLAIVFGINMAIIVAFFLSFEGHWRWMFASEVPPITMLMAGLLFAPKSPRWLASRADFIQALSVLSSINGRRAAEEILQDIKGDLKQDTGAFRELLQPGIRQALMIGVVLMIFQQINGVNMILLYTPTILIEAGIGSASNALLNSLYVNMCILLCTIVAFWLVGRYGRRPILIFGVAAMAAGHLLLGLALMLEWPLYVVILAMLICTAAFTLSLAPLGWVIISELYPTRIRAKAVSVVCFCLYSASFICTQVFPMITDWFQTTCDNQGGAYWVFAAICMLCVAFCWRVMPETKDMTLEDIGHMWLHDDKDTAQSLCRGGEETIEAAT